MMDGKTLLPSLHHSPKHDAANEAMGTECTVPLALPGRPHLIRDPSAGHELHADHRLSGD